MTCSLFSCSHAVPRRKVKELTHLNEAQEELLERRTVEYESLLESRRAEVDTMNVLSASLSETQELYDQAQREIVRLQVFLRCARLTRHRSKTQRNTKGRSPRQRL